jgi:acetyltransferase-like isoleucine patch superfamily enzyme
MAVPFQNPQRRVWHTRRHHLLRLRQREAHGEPPAERFADHNLLEIGDDVVIGADVHISGHTVEGGLLKTAPVRLGSHVTVGLGSVIDIDVEIGSGCQIGALTLVPKHSRLEGHAVYVGIPARPISESSV